MQFYQSTLVRDTCGCFPQLEAIIGKWGNKPLPDNYIFPYMKGNQTTIERKAIVCDVVKRINKHMELIGEELGIGNITTYTARHSYATVLKRSGANISYIRNPWDIPT